MNSNIQDHLLNNSIEFKKTAEFTSSPNKSNTNAISNTITNPVTSNIVNQI